jgi:predicted component of type VI protein secretion system
VIWLRDFATELDGAHAATTRLIALLQERSPAAPPSVRRIEESLHKMQRWIHAVLAERPEPMIEMQSVDPQLDGTGPTRPEEASAAASPATGAVQSREEAYRLLALAADYLLRTEPHSPTPYLVRRAVNWGKMPLAELLEEYSQDGNDLRMLRLLLGIVEGGRG